MKLIFTYFFVTLGVIFFGIILFLVYAWYANLWAVQGLVSYVRTEPLQMERVPANGMSSEQQAALEEAGLEAGMFANISAEQEVCFTNVLGAGRVEEIKAGAMPSLAEIAAGSECL